MRLAKKAVVFLLMMPSLVSHMWAEGPNVQLVQVKVEAEDANLGVELAGELMKEGAKHNLNFVVATGEGHDYRIVVVGERSAAVMGGAQTGALVLSPNCEVVTAVIRSGRWSKSGAARAVGKQLAKEFASLARLGQLETGRSESKRP